MENMQIYKKYNKFMKIITRKLEQEIDKRK